MVLFWFGEVEGPSMAAKCNMKEMGWVGLVSLSSELSFITVILFFFFLGLLWLTGWLG